MKTFLELDEKEFADTVLIIDIDGTITHDGEKFVNPEALQKLRTLSHSAKVYLCSNGNTERTRILAKDAQVSFIESLHKKPSRRVMERFEHSGKKIVVIGDKAITDGLFAVNIGAEFLQVKRLRSKNDSFLTYITYIIDDISGFFINLFYPILPHIALLRPTQWVKNILVLSPIFFAATAFHYQTFMQTLLAAIVFCISSSAMYLVNDIHDVEQDRLHPTKKYRPIASGKVSLNEAKLLFLILLIIVVLGICTIPQIAFVIGMYVVLNLLYSFSLKHIAVLDLVLVAVFYVLRVLAGGAATTTYISPWIILCVFFGALFIITGKRLAESRRVSKRKVLHLYSESALSYILISSATLAMMSYALYSILGSKFKYAEYSSVFVVVAIFRVLNQIYTSNEDAEYPEALVFKDKWVLWTTIAWVTYVAIMLYI